MRRPFVQTVPGRRATVFSVRFRGKIRSPGADGERRVGTACQNAVDFRDHDVRRHRLEAHRETRVARARTTRLMSGTALTTVGVVGILLDVTVFERYRLTWFAKLREPAEGAGPQ